MYNPNDPKLKSWVSVESTSDFPIQNLPFGVFQKNDKVAVGVAIGSMVLDLSLLWKEGFFSEIFPSQEENIFAHSSLNAFMNCGKEIWQKTRTRISQLLEAGSSELHDHAVKEEALVTLDEVKMLLPIKVGNFVDFYSSIEHATNIGSMFRPDNPLMPNWRHLPVGYNGRASSVIPSGTPIKRPKGQTKADDAENPTFGPSRLFDMELEMGFIIGKGNDLGSSISTKDAPDHVFGMVLLNDWSSRDIQKWEYVPLGPFLGKSFATSISPWVVTLDALEPFLVDGPTQEPAVLPHLQYEGKGNYDIHLEAYLQGEKMEASERITKTNFRLMYWNMQQQLAHQTSNGTNTQAGDLYGSGTVSGTTPDSLGSFLELSWRGTRPLKFPNGEERKFIQDNDTITLKGWCQGEGYRVGFGECSGKVLAAD